MNLNLVFMYWKNIYILGQTLIIVELLIKVCFSRILWKHHSIWLLKPFSSHLYVSFWTRTMIKTQMSFAGKRVRTGNTATPAVSVTFCIYPLISARPALTIMCLWNMHQEFPGTIQLTPFSRFFCACCQWTSAVLSSFTCFHRSASFSPSLSLCHSGSLHPFLCI